MTQEDKQLLLTDLCARLPYGVIIQEYNEEYGYTDNALNTIGIGYFSIHEASIEGTWINRIENVKPYLRPMSGMTEEEKRELSKKYVWDINCGQIEIRYHSDGYWDDNIECPTREYLNLFDWLNAHHFDYRGLIKKGLALEAPEGMYKID